MRFALCAYGDAYAGMLLTCLHSIRRSNADADVSVFWQDISPRLADALKQAFPEVEFVKTTFAMHRDYDRAISQKVLLWYEVVARHEGEDLCLLDTDTLVTGEVAAHLPAAAQIAYTVRPGKWAINTGVMLVRGAHTAAFFAAWRDLTIEIVESDDQSAAALRQYGGMDQMSFARLVQYDQGMPTTQVEAGGHTFTCTALSGDVLNQTRPVDEPTTAAILHYKGAWQNLLLKGQSISSTPDGAEREPMYELYLQTFVEALARVHAHRPALPGAAFGVRVPFYFDADLRPRPGRRRAFHYLEILYRWCGDAHLAPAAALLERLIFRH